MKDKQKQSAAIAAVLAYIQTEDEAVQCAALAAAQPPTPQPLLTQMPPRPMNLWGMSGRQTQMQMGSMMQMKAFHGAKIN